MSENHLFTYSYIFSCLINYWLFSYKDTLFLPSVIKKLSRCFWRNIMVESVLSQWQWIHMLNIEFSLLFISWYCCIGRFCMLGSPYNSLNGRYYETIGRPRNRMMSSSSQAKLKKKNCSFIELVFTASSNIWHQWIAFHQEGSSFLKLLRKASSA